MNAFKRFFLTMATITSKFIREAQKLPPLKMFLRAFSSAPQMELLPIRKELGKFEGGSVDLEMDEQTGIAVMTLNNPRRLNSMTGKMMVDMSDRITQLEQWKKGKGLILMGIGGNFCSGGDLTFVRKALHYGAEMATYQHHTLTRLLNLPLISVALLQGHTLGGGAELSTACDFRVMSPTAKVGFVQIKMGLTTGWGATTRLVHLLGRQKALGLLCSAKVLSAEEAKSEGLVDSVMMYGLSQEDEFTECKKWLVSNYCRHDSDLIQATKSSVVYSDLNRDLDTSLRNEREVFAQYWGGPAQKAALEANVKHNK
ncbi:ethylmalonyl-CoA decarboxylase [Aplysia californica]|uniref:Ethylmalonyl-CoA decarboxylase n=1 Tax=Aplysia californica TaxID=6500 RepID=A0ABM0JBX4_APLCA|nr:ethylmalonyl-CoA decarboxylase [Aplysia californica]